MGKEKLTKNALVKAINNSSGLISVIAKKLSVSRKTVHNYLNRYPELKELINEEKENILDYAESKLIKKIDEEEAWAIRFLLTTQGKTRGYGNKFIEDSELINYLPSYERLEILKRKEEKLSEDYVKACERIAKALEMRNNREENLVKVKLH